MCLEMAFPFSHFQGNALVIFQPPIGTSWMDAPDFFCIEFRYVDIIHVNIENISPCAFIIVKDRAKLQYHLIYPSMQGLLPYNWNNVRWVEKGAVRLHE
jgi:hypothetical protein